MMGNVSNNLITTPNYWNYLIGVNFFFFFNRGGTRPDLTNEMKWLEMSENCFKDFVLA